MDATESREQPPVAIVGISCRFSGNITHPEQLWTMLAKGQSGWSGNSGDRFKLESFWHPQASGGGSNATRGFHLLKQDPTLFDNDFFGVNNVESKAIDPQQRLMLEVAYEAFENAGIPLRKLEGSNTGVYCAVSNHDYEAMLGRDPELSPTYRFTGTGTALVSNRISYAMDLRGPSITFDTACSSGLVVMHEACKSIRAKEFEQVLVGATNLILDVDKVNTMSALQVLSPHGRCYAYDARANGFGRGEGVAALVLKSLPAAIRDGDSIRAVIRGSTINQDGKTFGITMPSEISQIEMIQKVYKDAKLNPHETIYVEGHGTGTKIGDKTEIDALRKTFCQDRSTSQNLFVGSVKANIGHTESVAGLAGVIKSILMLENRTIPPHIYTMPRKDLQMDEAGILVAKRLQEWPKDAPLRISVNSFGYGGTNSHLILEDSSEFLSAHCTLKLTKTLPVLNGTVETAPRCDQTMVKSAKSWSRIFVLSHSRPQGVAKVAKSLAHFIRTRKIKNPETTLDNLAYTLSCRRSIFPYRSKVVASDNEELFKALDEISLGIVRPCQSTKNNPICFVFTGQGAQWPRMGYELLSRFPQFRQSITMAEEHLLNLGAEWSLVAELEKDSDKSRIHDAELSQPCCTAVQIALADLFKSCNVRPDIVCGHSSGEIGAAYAAGYLTAKEALKVALSRGQAISQLKKNFSSIAGGMMAVNLSVLDAEKYMKDIPGEVVIACINSPNSVTLSGDQFALQIIKDRLTGESIFCRNLKVDVAYHSHHMELIRSQYVDSIKDLHPTSNNLNIKMISSVVGTTIFGNQLDANYWGDNLVSPVRFSETFEAAIRMIQSDYGSDVNISVVELGPHSALAGPVRDIIRKMNDKVNMTYNSALSRGQDSENVILELFGNLFARGIPVDITVLNHPTGIDDRETLTCLPTYPWHHEKTFSNESRISRKYRQRVVPRHDFLGIPIRDTIAAVPAWRNYISISRLPWLNDHCIEKQAVFPGAGYVTMAIEALRQQSLGNGELLADHRFHLRKVEFTQAMLLPVQSEGVEVIVTLRRVKYFSGEGSSPWNEFRVYSVKESGDSDEHCHGFVRALPTDRTLPKPKERLNLLTPKSGELNGMSFGLQAQLKPEKLYNELKSLGLEYSGPFAKIEEIQADSEQSVCYFKVPDIKSMMPGAHQSPVCIHPVTLDMCFQSIFPIVKAAGKIVPMVLNRIDYLEISSTISAQPGAELVVNASRTGAEHSKHFLDLAVTESSDGREVLRVTNMVYSSIAESQSDEFTIQRGSKPLCHKFKWAPDVICSDRNGILKECSINPEDPSASTRKFICDNSAQLLIQKCTDKISSANDPRVVGHFKLYIEWMKRQRKQPSEVICEESLDKQVALQGVMGEALLQFGDQLPNIVTGDVDAMSVFLMNNLLYRIYSTPGINRANLMLARYCQLLQFKNPNMRILEIGAGTTSTTLPVLNALFADKRRSGLPKIARYVFTDISSGFFDEASSKLEDFQDVLEFKRLDIESPAEQQGFEHGSFDLIIAANVLHATAELSQTLTNVRNLLKPGGKLVLEELTSPSLAIRLIFGTLPGWWLGAADGRLDSPTLDISGWQKVLTENGFSGVDIELEDFPQDNGKEISVMVSTATTAEQIQPAHAPVQIVCRPDEISNAMDLASSLRSGYPTMSVQVGTLEDVYSFEGNFIFLLELSEKFLSICSSDEWEKIKAVFSQVNDVLWITKGSSIATEDPERAMIDGLARAIRSENSGLTLVTLDLDSTCPSPTDDIQHIVHIYSQAFIIQRQEGSLKEYEYCVRDGKTLIPRLVEHDTLEDHIHASTSSSRNIPGSVIQPNRCLNLSVQTPGLLENFFWKDNERHSQPTGANEVRVAMRFMSLNFRDLMITMDELEKQHRSFMIEGSGVIVEVGAAARERFQVGDQVAVLSYESLATFSNIPCPNVQRIYSGMSLELAAAVPVAYATALYYLREVARLREGESILIHSAAGATGQAAVAIAKYLQAGEIYVTVGSEEKRKFVIEAHGIPEANIFSSRDLSFGQGLRSRTGGRGVDVVLNSLAGEAIVESLSVLAPFGRFIELGKKEFFSHGLLEMQYLENNISFSSIDLLMIAKDKPLLLKALLMDVFEGIHSNKIDILRPITVKSLSQVDEAFQMLQKGKHIGKLLLKVDPEVQVMIQPSPPPLAKVDPESFHLITGGTGGLGKAIIRLLVKLGAKHIVTLSRSGDASDDVKTLIRGLGNIGVELIAHKGSVCELENVDSIKQVIGLRPIKGIIQGSMVLQDSAFHNMTHDQWRAATDPKVVGTWNLENVFGSSLDYFILLSSTAGIIGSPGQSNYCAGNSFQDGFARYRTSKGLPVRTIDIGLVEGEGYTSENAAAAAHVHRQGLQQQKLSEFLAVVNYAISKPQPENPEAAQIICGAHRSDPRLEFGSSFQQPDPLFSHIWQRETAKQRKVQSTVVNDVRDSLHGALNCQEAVPIIETALIDKLSRLLAASPEDIRPELSVASFGVDSLIAVELRNWISHYLEAHIQIFELMSSMSLHQLAEAISKRSHLVPASQDQSV